MYSSKLVLLKFLKTNFCFCEKERPSLPMVSNIPENFEKCNEVHPGRVSIVTSFVFKLAILSSKFSAYKLEITDISASL